MAVRITTTYRGEGPGAGPTIADLEDFMSALPLGLARAEARINVVAPGDEGHLDDGWYVEVVEVTE